MPTSIFIIEALEIVRKGLLSALSSFSEFAVVGDAATLEVALPNLLQSKPDLVILDVRQKLAESIEQLKSVLPTAHILVFSAVESATDVQEAIHLGASGYIDKEASLHELRAGMTAVMSHRVFISHGSHLRKIPRIAENPTGIDASTLSEREMVVVELLAEGLTNQEIAERLYLSVKTIETYRARIIKKYGLKTRASLFQFAKRIQSNRARSAG
jgi:DNA-binding NarL/FixJ family response regulator